MYYNKHLIILFIYKKYNQSLYSLIPAAFFSFKGLKIKSVLVSSQNPFWTGVVCTPCPALHRTLQALYLTAL